MLAPCLPDLSKHDLKQVPEGGYRNLNSAFSKLTEHTFELNKKIYNAKCLILNNKKEC